MVQNYPSGYAVGAGQAQSQQPLFIIIPSGSKQAYQSRAQNIDHQNPIYADRRYTKLKIGSKPGQTQLRSSSRWPLSMVRPALDQIPSKELGVGQQRAEGVRNLRVVSLEPAALPQVAPVHK